MDSTDKTPERALWRATPLEVFFALSHDNGINLTCYSLALAARHPLVEEQVRTALQHLYRKVPSLRVCQRKDEEGHLWTCTMEEEAVLLQFLDDSYDYEETFTAETRKGYSVESGPLWRVSVLPATNVLDVSATSDGFGCHYHVMFGLHHAMTDGHSSIRICGYFIEILNDIIEGNTINDEHQLARFLDDRHKRQLTEEVRKDFESDSALETRYMQIIKKHNEIEPILFSALPSVEADPKTMFVYYELSNEKTTKFLATAKKQGVSIHSAFCSAINASIIDMLLSAGYDQEQYSLVSHHDLNERKYWNEESDSAFGIHIGAHKSLVHLPKDMKLQFWRYARLFHDQLHSEIKEKFSLRMEAMESQNETPVTEASKFYNMKTPCKHYFATSNMGDVTKFFRKSDGSQHPAVRAVSVRRSTSIHSYMTANTFCFQTMNGKLTCSLDFNTRYLSTSTAKNLLEIVFNTIAEVSQ